MAKIEDRNCNKADCVNYQPRCDSTHVEEPPKKQEFEPYDVLVYVPGSADGEEIGPTAGRVIERIGDELVIQIHNSTIQITGTYVTRLPHYDLIPLTAQEREELRAWRSDPDMRVWPSWRIDNVGALWAHLSRQIFPELQYCETPCHQYGLAVSLYVVDRLLEQPVREESAGRSEVKSLQQKLDDLIAAAEAAHAAMTEMGELLQANGVMIEYPTIQRYNAGRNGIKAALDAAKGEID